MLKASVLTTLIPVYFASHSVVSWIFGTGPLNLEILHLSFLSAYPFISI